MILRRSIIWLALATVSVATEAQSQRIPMRSGGPDSVRGREPRPRRRYLYERPAVSPWLGVDLGFGLPIADCQECTVNESGPAFIGSIGAGVTLLSRVTLAAERSTWSIIYYEQDARVTMYSARLNSRRGLSVKGGYGKASYKKDPSLLVDNKPAWMAGTEYCHFDRVDGCALLDYTQSAIGSPAPFNAVHVTYRLHAVRLGFAVRAHLFPGKRISLPPRELQPRMME